MIEGVCIKEAPFALLLIVRSAESLAILLPDTYERWMQKEIVREIFCYLEQHGPFFSRFRVLLMCQSKN